MTAATERRLQLATAVRATTDWETAAVAMVGNLKSARTLARAIHDCSFRWAVPGMGLGQAQRMCTCMHLLSVALHACRPAKRKCKPQS